MSLTIFIKRTFLFLLLFSLSTCAPATQDLQSTVEAAVAQTFVAISTSTDPSLDTAVPPTETLVSTPTLEPGAQRLAETDGMTQLYVPAGEFIMGSPLGDPTVFANEQPQHSTYLDAFWIDQTEVTNDLYTRCVQAGGCTPPRDNGSAERPNYYGNPQFANYPVVWVDWQQAQAYCTWAARRLPTEAEWEKAARGPSGGVYPWGGQELMAASLAAFEDPSSSCALAHYHACEPYGDTAAVGQRLQGASPYGALDMGGNVWEWVADWYGEDYYTNSPTENPAGPADGTEKILRGGSFASNFSRYLRGAYRYPFDPNQTIFGFGFRCAQDITN